MVMARATFAGLEIEFQVRLQHRATSLIARTARGRQGERPKFVMIIIPVALDTDSQLGDPAFCSIWRDDQWKKYHPGIWQPGIRQLASIINF